MENLIVKKVFQYQKKTNKKVELALRQNNLVKQNLNGPNYESSFNYIVAEIVIISEPFITL